MPKALDYAYACLNGELKCFNTHGLTIDHFSEWDPVHNMANCEGTAKPDCSGNGPWWGTGPGGSAKLPPEGAMPPYDYIVATATKNRIDTYGVVIRSDENENYYPLTLDQFIALTGQKTIFIPTGTNRRVYRPQYLRGSKLLEYNSKIYNVKSTAIDAAKSYFRTLGVDSLEYFVEILDFYSYNVKDNNDIAEVMTKYLALRHPGYEVLNADYVNNVSKFYKARYNNDIIPMEKSFDFGNFDITSIVMGAMGILAELFGQGTEMAIRTELTQWMNWFTNQMTIDYNDIVTTEAERGPQAAVDWIKNLENTSWRDIQNYITNWCGSKGIPVPSTVNDVYKNFLDLKLALIEATKTGSTNPTYGPPPATSAPTEPSESSGIGKILLWVGVGVGAFLILKNA